MNKHRYKLLFCRIREMLVPVAEFINHTTGDISSPDIKTEVSARCFLLRQLAGRISLTLFGGGLSCILRCQQRTHTFLLPVAFLSSGIPSAFSAEPEVMAAPNGVPVINIVKPDTSGLSHNTQKTFNVDAPGVIFNNSAQDGTRSALGGLLPGNPALKGGNEASAILMEVNGDQRTSIGGALEINGRTADLFIANENGISLNGNVTTINTRNLTLSTGRPVITPQGLQFDVRKGDVIINGQLDTRFNPSPANGALPHPQALSSFDVVALSAQLNGQVESSTAEQADIHVVTGQNRYDMANHRVSGPASEAKPGDDKGYGISGSNLGSMYGRNVSFVSTASGAGVRQPGAILSTDDIVIDAGPGGDVVSGRLIAGKNADVFGKNITLAGSQHSATGTGLRIQASADLNISQQITSTGPAELTAENVTVGDRGELSAQQVAVNTGHLNVSSSGTISGINALHISASGNVENAGTLGSGGSLVLDGNQLDNSQGGTLYARDSIQLSLRDAVHNAGTLLGERGVTIDASQLINDEKGYLQAGQDVMVHTRGMTDNQGRLLAGRRLNVGSGLFRNQVSGYLGLSGVSLQESLLALKTPAATALYTPLTMPPRLAAESVGATDQQIVIQSDESLINDGSIMGAGITLKARTATNSGSIHASQGISLLADSLHQASSGQLISDGSLNLVATDIELAKNSLLAGDRLQITADNTLQVAGNIQAADSLDISGNTLSVDSTGDILAGRALWLDTAHYQNGAENRLRTNGSATLYLRPGSDLTFSDSNFSPLAAGVLSIQADTITLDGLQGLNNPGDILFNARHDMTNNSLITGGRNVGFAVTGTLQNSKGSDIWAGGDIQWQGDNLINQQGAVLESRGDMILRGDTVTNDAGATLQSGGDIIARLNTLNNNAFVSGVTSVLLDDGSNYLAEQDTDVNLVRYNIAKVYFKAPVVSANVPEIQQGVVRAKGNILINQDADDPNVTVNNQSVISAEKNVQIKGLTDNTSVQLPIPVGDVLNQTQKDGQNRLTADTNISTFGHYWDKNFSTLFGLLDFVFGAPGSVNIWGAYYADTEEFANAMKRYTESSTMNQLMSSVLGADWRAVDYGVLSGRWNEAKQTNFAGQTINAIGGADTKAAISAGGNVLLTGAGLKQGAEPMQSGQLRPVTIGKYTFSALAASLDPLLLKNSDQDNDFLSPFAEITNSKRFVVRENTSPVLLASGIRVQYLYETRNQYIDPNQFYGSEYFLNHLGYSTTETLPLLGDAVLENRLVDTQIARMTSGRYVRIFNGSDTDLQKQLLDNGLAAASQYSLQLGEPLTEAQQQKLDHDLIWYVREHVDGKEVLVPRVYLCPKTQALLNTEDSKAQNLIGAGKTVYVSTGKEGISANSALFTGKNILLESMGDIALRQSSLLADNALQIKTDANFTQQGGKTEGDSVDIRSDGLHSISTDMGYDHDGNTRINMDSEGVRSGAVIARKGDVILNGKKGIVLTAADLQASGTTTLATQGDVLQLGVDSISSSYQHSRSGDLLGGSSSTTTRAASQQTGTRINTDKLVYQVDGNLTDEGGQIDARQTHGDIKGSQFLKAGRDVAFEEKTDKNWGFTAGASARVGNAAAGVNNIHGNGQTTFTSGADGTVAGDQVHADQNSNNGGTVRWGYEINEHTRTENSQTYHNSQLNFGTGGMFVGKNVDLGGADINANAQSGDKEKPALLIDAASYSTTKYLDETDVSEKSSSLFIGHTIRGTSSLADVVANKVALGDKVANQGQKLSGLTVAELAGDASTLTFADAAGVSGGLGFSYTSQTSQSNTQSENINKVGGDVTFRAREGDIDLKGVLLGDDDGKSDIALIAEKGNVRFSATKSSASLSSERVQSSLQIDSSGGVGPSGAGLGISATLSTQYDKSTQNGADYTNSRVNVSNLVIKTAKDLELDGAKVVSEERGLDIGGKTLINTRQNNSNFEHTNVALTASAGVALSSQSGGAPIPTGSATVSGGKDYDNSRLSSEQSGLYSKAAHDHIAGDLELNGGVLQAGTGSLELGGKVITQDIQDSRRKDGGTGGGGGGGGISKNGLATVNVVATRVDQVNYDATQKSTVDYGNGSVNAKGGIQGGLNRDASMSSEVTRDENIAGNQISITLGDPRELKRGAKKTQKAEERGTPQREASSGTGEGDKKSVSHSQPGTINKSADRRTSDSTATSEPAHIMRTPQEKGVSLSGKNVNKAPEDTSATPHSGNTVSVQKTESTILPTPSDGKLEFAPVPKEEAISDVSKTTAVGEGSVSHTVEATHDVDGLINKAETPAEREIKDEAEKNSGIAIAKPLTLENAVNTSITRNIDTTDEKSSSLSQDRAETRADGEVVSTKHMQRQLSAQTVDTSAAGKDSDGVNKTQIIIQADDTAATQHSSTALSVKKPDSTIMQATADGELKHISGPKSETISGPVKVVVVGHGGGVNEGASTHIGLFDAGGVKKVINEVTKKTNNGIVDRVALVGCNTCALANEVGENFPGGRVTGQDRIVAVGDNGRKYTTTSENPLALSPFSRVLFSDDSPKESNLHLEYLSEYQPGDLLYSDKLLKTANKYNVILGFRMPNPLGKTLLEEGYPTKNFHVKAKSSPTGPTAAFIAVDPTLSKVKNTPAYLHKQELYVKEALSKGANEVPLEISSNRVDELLKNNHMIKNLDDTYSAFYPSGEKRFNLAKNNSKMHSVLYAETKEPVKVLTNASWKYPDSNNFPVDLSKPITADYDLFDIVTTENQKNNFVPVPPVPKAKFRSRNEGLDNSKVGYPEIDLSKLKYLQFDAGKEDADMGNIGVFTKAVVKDINKSVSESYSGGPLVWHGHESLNPFSEGFNAEDAPIFVIPKVNKVVQVSSIDELGKLYQSFNKMGYSPGFTPRMGIPQFKSFYPITSNEGVNPP